MIYDKKIKSCLSTKYDDERVFLSVMLSKNLEPLLQNLAKKKLIEASDECACVGTQINRSLGKILM